MSSNSKPRLTAPFLTPPNSETCHQKTDPFDTCQFKSRRTEYLEKFPPQQKRRNIEENLRRTHMDRFLYAEMTRAYMDRIQKREAIENITPTATEYTKEFHQPPLDHSIEDAAVVQAYPLYGTEAISLWCPELRIKSPFKQSHHMTKPNAECFDEQFR